MSRIGNAPITLPSGTTLSFKDNVVTVKGPKGELTQELDSAVSVEEKDGVVTLTRSNESKDAKAKHGLYRSLVNNMVEGCTKGYQLVLELHGVGYRATTKGQILELSLGYSHPIHIELAKEIKVTADTKKGQAPVVTLESHDKQLVGQAAAKIRSFRKPEPYKGKGVRFKGEEIRRKAGKAAGK